MRTLFVLFALLGTLVGPAAQTRSYLSFKGFKLRYPADWVMASKDLPTDVLESLLRTHSFLREVDLDQAEVCVFAPGGEGLAANLVVIITPGRLPDHVLAREGTEFVQALIGQLTRAGMDPERLTKGVTTVGSKQAMSIQYEALQTQFGVHTKVWQVAVPGNQQTYVFTFTAPDEEFAKYEDDFDAIVKTIRVDAGLGGVWYSIPESVRSGLAGASVGLLALLLLLLPKLFRISSRSERRKTRFNPTLEGFKGSLLH